MKLATIHLKPSKLNNYRIVKKTPLGLLIEKTMRSSCGQFEWQSKLYVSKSRITKITYKNVAADGR